MKHYLNEDSLREKKKEMEPFSVNIFLFRYQKLQDNPPTIYVAKRLRDI